MYVFIPGNLTPLSLAIKSLLYWSGTTTGLQEQIHRENIEKLWMVWNQESFNKYRWNMIIQVSVVLNGVFATLPEIPTTSAVVILFIYFTNKSSLLTEYCSLL